MITCEILPISVVIPTLNAAQTIGMTLSSLSKNSKKPREILVIDGLSKDETVDIAKEYGCKVLINPQVHTAASRQLGITTSIGDIVAMTDSDCVPDAFWLERIYTHFLKDPALDGVGGVVRLENPLTRVQSYCATKALSGHPRSEEYIVHKTMRGRFPGSNCAYRRTAIIEVGGFDLKFRNHGEDIDLFWRLVGDKKRLLFDPNLIVEHLGFSQNLTALARKSFGYGMASAWLASTHFVHQKNKIFKNLVMPWIHTFQEWNRLENQGNKDCVFVDKIMFALGKTWGAIKKAKGS